MTDRFLLTLLGPILLAQGRRVRRQALILPEPQGDRQGTRGRGPGISLLVVGDSSAAGVGAATQDEALLGHLVRLLAREHEVRFRLVARTGLTTPHILKLLGEMPAATFDLAVTSLGVNDTTRLREPQDFVADQEALLKLLQDKFGARRVVVTGLPPMHLFPALPRPLRWVLGRRARQLDTALARLLESIPGATHLDSAFTRDAGLMAPDGFHPGPELYRTWADRAVEILLPRCKE